MNLLHGKIVPLLKAMLHGKLIAHKFSVGRLMVFFLFLFLVSTFTLMAFEYTLNRK